MSTIVALSTAPGRGAIAIVRLSGPDSFLITRKLVGEDLSAESARITLHTIRDPKTGVVCDQVMVTHFKAPRSYTGENLVEINCHGSPVIVRRIIDLTLAHGARLADPGEFTLRSLGNGKIDLSQAEAIRDLVNAQTEAAARQAIRQLGGELSSRLQPSKDRLVEVIVRLESAVEFVEDDLPQLQFKELENSVRDVAEDVSALASSFSAGHWLRDGIKATIVGKPNVGKSSLFNRLLERDRAIVTDIPGTTRDTLSEQTSIDGVPIILTDTAGVRGAPDLIESIGISRTRQAMSDSDVVLAVIDGSQPTSSEDLEVLSQASNLRYLVVVNKCDLPVDSDAKLPSQFGDKGIRVSALDGEGIDHLCEAILDAIGFAGSNGDALLLTDARHHDLLQRSATELLDAVESFAEGASEELILVNLYNALRFLGAITGETTTEEILSEIFSTFCIGK